MTKQDIFDLIACFDGSTASSMKLSTKELTLELTRNGGEVPATAPRTASAGPSVSAICEEPAITAPLVGVFYAAPAPDQPPFAAVGDRVAKGQTVCLLEAMKMMSEVTAPCDCVILEVLKPNGELAEYGEPLFRYQPC